MGSIDNLRLSLNNVRVVVDLFMLFLAMSDHNILTLLNIGDIYDNIIVNITFLMMLLLGGLVALVVLLIMTMRTIMICMTKMMTTRVGSTVYKSSRKEDDKELHFGLKFRADFPPCMTKELK